MDRGRQKTRDVSNVNLYREHSVLVAAGRQRGGVVGTKPFWIQAVYDAVEHRGSGDHSDPDVRRHPGVSVRDLGTDRFQRGLRHKSHDIVQQRGVRAKTPRRSHVRHQSVLLRRLPVRDHVVRRHGRLETVGTIHRGHTGGQRRVPIQGERARNL